MVMQKSTSVLLYILSGALIVSSIGLSSCGSDDDDDNTETKPVLTVAEEEIDVFESDGTIEIEVKLDKAASEDITIEYELSGTAQDEETADNDTDPEDYKIVEDYGEIEIEAGETTGTITLELYSDDWLENDETIEISITDVDGDVEIGSDDETTINLKQEDGMLVALVWAKPSSDGEADMDMFTWIGETAESPDWDGVLTGSIYRGTDYDDTDYAYEVVFLPNTFVGSYERIGLSYDDTSFGFAYTYYDGDLDPLEFQVEFIEFIDSDYEADEDVDIYTGTYTLANLNKWTGQNYSSTIVQTMRLNDGEFQDISDITIPTEGSRQSVAKMNTTLRPLSTRTLKSSILRKGAFEKLIRK